MFARSVADVGCEPSIRAHRAAIERSRRAQAVRCVSITTTAAVGLAYLAAYDVQHTKVFGCCAQTTGIVPFTRLVDQVMTCEPYTSATGVFWIVDNGSPHVVAVEALRGNVRGVVSPHRGKERVRISPPTAETLLRIRTEPF